LSFLAIRENQHFGTPKSAFIRYIAKDAFGKNNGTLQSTILANQGFFQVTKTSLNNKRITFNN
jgi:hypothetical protein